LPFSFSPKLIAGYACGGFLGWLLSAFRYQLSAWNFSPRQSGSGLADG
jgi:hypothetical protein